MTTPHARIVGLAVALLMALAATTPVTAQSAFDAYGYNQDAMIFIGTGDSWDRTLDGVSAGDPAHANDRLTMRWNAEWARGMQEGWADPDGYAGAWLSHSWNGNVPGGSGELASYKIDWVGACATGEPVAGSGTCFRDQFAVMVDSGGSGGDDAWTTYASLPIYGVTFVHADQLATHQSS